MGTRAAMQRGISSSRVGVRAADRCEKEKARVFMLSKRFWGLNSPEGVPLLLGVAWDRSRVLLRSSFSCVRLRILLSVSFIVLILQHT